MAAHSYWRIFITANQSSGTYFTEVAELQFRTTRGTPLQATGGTPVYSSQYQTSGNQSASAAFDNNTTTTYWLSAGATGPEYIGYHYPSPIDVKEVALTACNSGDSNSSTVYAPKAFSVDYSDDGITWYSTIYITSQTNWIWTPVPDTRLFTISVLAGIIVESLPITNWRITASKCSDGTFVGTTLSGEAGTTYSIVTNILEPCNVICAPKIDYVWPPNKSVLVNDYSVSANPDTTPHIWKCTANSGDSTYITKKLLLHCNGTNASTTFTDNSSNPKTFTTNGNAQITTSSPKFGTGSYLGDGTGDYITCSHNDFLFTNGNNHTIEFWLKSADGAVQKCMMAQGNSSNYYFLTYGGGNIRVYRNVGGSAWYDLDIAHTTDTNWHHFAWCKVGSTNTVYIDGVSIGSWTRADWSFLPNRVDIGGDFAAGDTNSWNGVLDEIVIDTSVAYYTTNFTPPIVPYLDSYGATGGTEPIWNLLGTTTDNTITWTYVGPIPNPLVLGPKIPV